MAIRVLCRIPIARSSLRHGNMAFGSSAYSVYEKSPSYNAFKGSKHTTEASVIQKLRNERKSALNVLETEPERKVVAVKDGKAVITVIGLGGAGGNAVNNMIASQLQGVEFMVANTDSQALARSLAHRKITLGKTTRGLGAGGKPELGRIAAEEQLHDIIKHLEGSNMLFITGGMGGGTCTGAAPVIAKAAREMGILTVAVVSTPFRSEGPNRTRIAHKGIASLSQVVDTLIIVPNQNLLSLSTQQTTMVEAFRYADNILLDGVRGVTDLIVKPGMVNLDFADIRTILGSAGRAIMGSGTATNPNRAKIAADKALSNPLLGELPIDSACGVLVTISGGSDITLFEVDEIMELITKSVSPDANIIFGSCYDEDMLGKIHVSVIIGGIDTTQISPPVKQKQILLHPPDTEISSDDIAADRITSSDGFLRRFFSF